MRPINRKWLKDSVILYEVKRDPYGDDEFTVVEKIEHVRVEHASKVIKKRSW